MGNWTIGEICCGGLCASLSATPRSAQHIGIKKHALSFNSSVQSMLTRKQNRSSGVNTETNAKTLTIYGPSVKPLSNEKKSYAELDLEESGVCCSSGTKS